VQEGLIHHERRQPKISHSFTRVDELLVAGIDVEGGVDGHEVSW
jgi:hypothetical protein